MAELAESQLLSCSSDVGSAETSLTLTSSLVHHGTMSVSESGAYFPSSFTFPAAANSELGPDDEQNGFPDERQCSVRGCHRALSADSANKMCLPCREKHRTYASTKRARRKLEKAAMEGQTIVPVEQIPGSTAWMPAAEVPFRKPKKPVCL